MKRRFPIGSRLVLSISAALLAVLAIIATAIYVSYKASLDRQLALSARQTTDLIKEEISSWLAPKEGAVEASRVEAERLYPDMKGLAALFAERLKDDPDFTDVYLFTKTSYKDGGLFADGSGWIPPKDYDNLGRVWYQQAVAAQGLVLSPPYIDAQTGKLVVTVARRFAWAGDQAAGVTAADMFITRVGEIIAQTRKISANGKSYLLGSDGMFITNEASDKVLKASPFDDPRLVSIKPKVLDPGAEAGFFLLPDSGIYVGLWNTANTPTANIVIQNNTITPRRVLSISSLWLVSESSAFL